MVAIRDAGSRRIASWFSPGRIDLAHCFFDLRGCFWSVVHPLAIEVSAPRRKDVADSNRQEKKQLPKLMKMTPRLIFVSTTLHTWQNSPVLQQFQGPIKVEQLYLFRAQSQMPGQGPIE